jgi:mycothiol synthase
MFARRATNDDVELVLDIFNSHQLSVAPEAGTNNEDWAIDFIQGYPEPYTAWLLGESEDSVPFAVGNLNPSSNAKRFQADISIRPGVKKLDDVLTFFRDQAKEFADGWSFWTSCNSADEYFHQVLLSQGFKVNRYFNTLRSVITEANEPLLPAGVSYKQIDIFDESDMKIWHDLRLDAFSKHFGFKPRPFESFVEIMQRDPMMAKAIVLVLFENNVPAGYIWINDQAAHEGIGYVQNLGVAYAFQGKGYGQWLLAKAIKLFADRGFHSAELGVDTGNESGALRLYEKMGFKLVTSWTQYED